VTRVKVDLPTAKGLDPKPNATGGYLPKLHFKAGARNILCYMAEQLLEQLSRQYDLLSQRFIELEVAYSDSQAQLFLKGESLQPNTSTISTRSAVTPLTSRKQPFMAKGTKESPDTSRYSLSDMSMAHSALRKLQGELRSESTKRKMAENEVFRLQHLMNKSKARDEHMTRNGNLTRIATPRTVSGLRGDMGSARAPSTSRIVPLGKILDEQLDGLRTHLSKVNLDQDESTELQRKVEAIRGVALWMVREQKETTPITARRHKQTVE